MPHCAAPCSRKEACSADSLPLARPSTVRTAAARNTRRRNEAGADRFVVEHDRAGAAIAGVAADLGAGEMELVAQHRRQPPHRRHVDRDRGAVDREADAWRDRGSCRALLSRLRLPCDAAAVAASARDTISRAAPRRYSALPRTSSIGVRSAKCLSASVISASERMCLPAQFALQPAQPLRDRRAGADRDRRVGHHAVVADRNPHRRHGDRDDEIAPRAELEEGRCAGQRCLGQADRGHHFVRRKRRLAVAADEGLRAARVACREAQAISTSASRISSAGTPSAAGEALQILPATVPVFWIWTEPTSRAACFSASKAGGSGCAMMSVQLVRAPMTRWVARLGDAAQFGKPVDVEHVLAERLGAERRVEIGAARQDAPRAFARAARAPHRPIAALRSEPNPVSVVRQSEEIHSYANDIKRRQNCPRAVLSAGHAGRTG